jgi:Zn-dependent protease
MGDVVRRNVRERWPAGNEHRGFINVSLMVLNLLPILPLDGGRIALSLLPHRLAIPYSNTERFGFVVVILLIVSGALGVVLGPFFRATLTFIGAITGIDLR